MGFANPNLPNDKVLSKQSTHRRPYRRLNFKATHFC